MGVISWSFQTNVTFGIEKIGLATPNQNPLQQQPQSIWALTAKTEG